MYFWQPVRDEKFFCKKEVVALFSERRTQRVLAEQLTGSAQYKEPAEYYGCGSSCQVWWVGLWLVRLVKLQVPAFDCVEVDRRKGTTQPNIAVWQMADAGRGLGCCHQKPEKAQLISINPGRMTREGQAPPVSAAQR